MSDNDFINDPLFNQLRSFAAADDAGRAMPPEIRQGFRLGIKNAKKRRFAWRGGLGAGLIIIAFPTLAAAKILPHPIQHFVERVDHVVASPVHKLITLTTSNDVVTLNRGHKHVIKIKNTPENINSILAPDETPSQESNPSQQGILSSLGKAIESANPGNNEKGKGRKEGQKGEGKNSTGALTLDQNVTGDVITNPSSALPLPINTDNPQQVNSDEQGQHPKKTPPSHDANGGVGKAVADKPSKSRG